MKHKRLIQITAAAAVFFCSIIYAATITFTAAETNDGRGKKNAIDKITVTVTPASNEPNIGGASDVNINGELQRVSYDVNGSDDDYTVNIWDETNRIVYSKTDCNVDASFAVEQVGASGAYYTNVPMAGAFTVDVCDLGKTEIQTLTITSDANDPNGGTFEVSLNDINTAPIAYDCNATVFEAAMEDLNNVDSVTVTGNGLYDGNSLVVTFLGDWYGDDVNMLVIDVNGLTFDFPGTVFTGNETETQKGAYDVNEITITIYYRDEKF